MSALVPVPRAEVTNALIEVQHSGDSGGRALHEANGLALDALKHSLDLIRALGFVVAKEVKA